jgi:hypothetical protein
MVTSEATMMPVGGERTQLSKGAAIDLSAEAN